MKAALVLREMTDLLGENMRADAEWLLAHTLGLTRLEARLADIGDKDRETALALAKRRASGEPLQYITGLAGFYGRDFFVRPGVLIPRFDTETLIEVALDLLLDTETPDILDMCTGSGILAVTMALEKPKARLTAADISEGALDIARKNAETFGVSRIRFVQGNMFARVAGKFDMIMSNPPYIPAEDIAELMREVRDFEPKLALDGGVDGLSFYRIIAREAPAYLRRGGYIALEFGDGQAEALGHIFAENFADIRIHKDLGGLPRVLTARLAEK